ncbi:hypothetical protein GE061_009063 [Apolygus lucorum]|uniref:COMM domain-containing protein n=1 Tax=Apolygus lucorum TaxID=248454 RepID=A0A6A4JZ87_APOLU|nr:hypothetical protein GE061_012154 [Apolygus lucorum]KAF6214323.1 hypothetical protein GE061_009063 [Apolygus lucorum]
MDEQKLVDYDWNFEFVIGSSAVSTVDQPLLHLRLDLGGGRVSSAAAAPSAIQTSVVPLDVELDRSQLKNLISELETALSA